MDIEISKALRTFFVANDTTERRKYPTYFSYKNVLYKVNSIVYGPKIVFTLDEVNILIENLHNKYDMDILRKLGVDDIIKEIQQIKTNNELTEEEKFQQINEIINVSEIKEAKVEYANDITLFWCPKCFNIFYEHEIERDKKHKYPRCPKCRKIILEQTPVWIRRRGRGKPVLPIVFGITRINYNEASKSWSNRMHIRCPTCNLGELRIYKSEDPARYLEKSFFYCNNCGRKYGLYSQNFVLSPPTQNIISPIIAGSFSKSSIKRNYIELKKQLTNSPVINVKYVKTIRYLNSVNVKEVVIGYQYGLHVKNIIKTEYVGRSIKVNGMYIKLNDGYFNIAKRFLKEVYLEDSSLYEKHTKMDVRTIIRTVLHSLAHAIISQIPIYSGLSIDNFNYIYSIGDRSVLIYEIADGGLGALYTLTRINEETKEPLIVDFLANIRETIKNCNCDDRCKYCIAIKGCAEFNDHLNRFSLAPLMNLEVDDVSWGF